MSRFPKVLLAGLILALALVTTGRAADSLAGLPLEVHPGDGKADMMVVLLSGDGGWQALDWALARRFNQAGLGVVSLDSYAYFLRGKTPERLAADLDLIVSFYGARWHARRVVLAGYSFGADALPFAWPHLSAGTRGRTSLIALLALVPAADFRISIWEMLDIPSADDRPVGPALRRLPATRVLCVYGVEDDTACTLPELRRARVISLPGGHRFNQDYDTVADLVLRRAGVHRDAPSRILPGP